MTSRASPSVPPSRSFLSAADDVDVQLHVREGRINFFGIELLCGAGSLVPRRVTETLAQAAVDLIRDMPPPVKVVDLGCGTGNLACAIATHVPHAHLWASDITDECVAWTRRNVNHLGLDARVSVAQGDLFEGVADQGLEGAVDVIVCNPPYIPSARLNSDRKRLLQHEPREAFDGGAFGLDIYQRLVRHAPAFLKPGGWLLVECGRGQHRQVEILANRTGAYSWVEFHSTEDGEPRVVAARLRRP